MFANKLQVSGKKPASTSFCYTTDFGTVIRTLGLPLNALEIPIEQISLQLELEASHGKSPSLTESQSHPKGHSPRPLPILRKGKT